MSASALAGVVTGAAAARGPLLTALRPAVALVLALDAADAEVVLDGAVAIVVGLDATDVDVDAKACAARGMRLSALVPSVALVVVAADATEDGST